MRAELNNLEQIDLYLSGNMSAAQKSAFEAQMAADPALKSIVEDQQLLIQTVNRQALIAEINTIAGVGAAAAAGSAGGFSTLGWVVSGIVAAGAIGTAVYISSSDPSNENPEANELIVSTEVKEGKDEETIGYDDALDTNISVEDEEAIAAIEEIDLQMNPIVPVEHHNEGNSSNYSPQNNQVEEDDDSKELIHSSKTIKNKHKDHGIMNNGSASNKTNYSPQKNSNKSGKGTKKSGKTTNKENASNTFVANQTASFPNGDLERTNWVDKHLRYPRTPKDKGLEGIVKVTFFVNPDGQRTNIDPNLIRMSNRSEADKPYSGIQILRNGKSARMFEKEAARIVRIMPDWVPATDRYGNPVISEQILYVKFDIEEGCYVYQLN
jgi:outer membrane biosynthesis protein TonB